MYKPVPMSLYTPGLSRVSLQSLQLQGRNNCLSTQPLRQMKSTSPVPYSILESPHWNLRSLQILERYEEICQRKKSY